MAILQLWNQRLDLAGMPITASALLHWHRANILELAALHGVTNMRVLGSLARGEECADSDVDRLVTLEEGRSLLDLVGQAGLGGSW